MCMKDNKHVTSLKLSGVNMDDEGAKFMAALIKMNSSLMQIDLSNNSIGTFIYALSYLIVVIYSSINMIFR